MDQYYVLNLWEPATPSFCSFAKPYVGSKQDILTVATQLADDDPGSETVRAIQDYFTGNHSATHHIAYQEMPVLTPIRVLASSRMDLPMKTWEHLNVYECPYRMRFEAAEVFQIVICYEGRYHRCVKSRFQNLCYDGINDDWHPVGTMFFGNGCVMRVCETAHQTRLVENILYVQEESAEDSEMLIQKLEIPAEVIFERICDEIFGDGWATSRAHKNPNFPSYSYSIIMGEADEIWNKPRVKILTLSLQVRSIQWRSSSSFMNMRKYLFWLHSKHPKKVKKAWAKPPAWGLNPLLCLNFRKYLFWCNSPKPRTDVRGFMLLIRCVLRSRGSWAKYQMLWCVWLDACIHAYKYYDSHKQ